MLKVYLAAPYSQKTYITYCATELREAGVTVTSSWLEENEAPTSELRDLSPWTRRDYAIRDVKDVMAADIMVLFNDPTHLLIRQGRTAEMGMFIGRRAATHQGLPIFVVGLEMENIFHHLPQVPHFENWEKVRDLL